MQYVFYAVYAIWVIPEMVDLVRHRDGGPDLDAKSRYGIYAAIGVTIVFGFMFVPVAPSWADLDSVTVPLFWVGAALMLVGVGFCFGTWPTVLVAFASGVAGFGYRIHTEERALHSNLDGYDDYCSRVPYRLVPKIY